MPIGAVGQMQRAGVDPSWKPSPSIDTANDRIADFSLNRVPQPLPPNHSYQLPMQQQAGQASALADRAISGQSVMPASNYDPAVWGPGGRQYPTATPAASPAAGLQSPVVAPRYGQSAQQAAMSLQNARQQASDFTNRGVGRIFATNGGTVERGIGAMNGATAMPYGSGSTIIRTADGRTILAGRSPDSRAESSIATAMSQNGGTVPQGVFDSIQRASAANSAARNAQNPMMTQRRADMKAQDAAARDRQIVSNAMRFGVRNPLAIQTAQRMGIRLPGMPRMSGDSMVAGSAEPTTAQINASLTRAQQNPVYADIQAGFDPGAAQGSQWAAMLQQPNVQKMTPSEVNRVKQELRDATKSKTYRSTATDAEVIDAFLSGGPQAVKSIKESRRQKHLSQIGLTPERMQTIGSPYDSDYFGVGF